METLRQENRKTETVMAAGVFLVMLRKVSLSLISGVTSGSRIHRFLAAFPNRQCQTCESYLPSLTSWVTDTTLYDVCSCAVWLLLRFQLRFSAKFGRAGVAFAPKDMLPFVLKSWTGALV